MKTKMKIFKYISLGLFFVYISEEKSYSRPTNSSITNLYSDQDITLDPKYQYDLIFNSYTKPNVSTDQFKYSFTFLYNKSPQSSIIMLPCGAKWPLYDLNTGYAWGPTGKSILFYDTCGAQWKNFPSWATPQLDRGIGDNNPVLTNINGSVFLSRQGTSWSNPNGLLHVQAKNWLTDAPQWPGGVDADTPTAVFSAENSTYDLDGKTISRGSPLALHAITSNYSNQSWSIQAQALKETCYTREKNGSCWANSSELYDVSGFSPTSKFSQTNENDLSGNGKELNGALFNPSLSARIMDYAHGMANTYQNWQPLHTYKPDDKVLVNKSRILISTSFGKSGNHPPEEIKNEDSILKDGSVTWIVGAEYNNTVGVVHWINTDGGEGSQHNTYNFGYSTNAKFNNSVFDTSHASGGNLRFAALRIGSDQGIDVSASSHAVSDNDINRNIWKYVTVERSFDYFIDGIRKLSIQDNGNVLFSGAIVPETKTRSAILALKPAAGSHPIYYDSTDDAPAIYTNKSWKLMVLKDIPTK